MNSWWKLKRRIAAKCRSLGRSMRDFSRYGDGERAVWLQLDRPMPRTTV